MTLRWDSNSKVVPFRAISSLPTGAPSVSSHGFDPFVKFPWSKELDGGWSVGGVQSLFWNTEDRRRNPIWEPTLYIEKQITKPLAAIFFALGYSFRIDHR